MKPNDTNPPKILNIRKEENPVPTEDKPRWKMLVVDDDDSILAMTEEVLQDFYFEGKRIEIITASSAKDAKVAYDKHSHIAVAMIDCVMEKNNSGLLLIEYIRHTKNNTEIQLVLRTGQPDFAPAHNMLMKYSINDYLSKTELTSQKLTHRVIAYLRTYSMMREISILHQQSRHVAKQTDQAFSKISHQMLSLSRDIRDYSKGLSIEQHELFIQHMIESKSKKLSSLLSTITSIDNTGDTSALFTQSITQLKEMINDITYGLSHYSSTSLTKDYELCLTSVMSKSDELVNFAKNLDLTVLGRYSSMGSLYGVIEQVFSTGKVGSDASVILKNELNPDIPQLFMNRNNMITAIEQLMQNAIDHTPSGFITACSRTDENYLFIEIKDTGFGIKPELLEEIQRMLSKDQPLSINPANTTGLLQVKAIIESHNGKLYIDSTHGEGTCVTLKLPYSDCGVFD